MPKTFYCKYCDYKTTKKSSFDDHLKSRKHSKNINLNPINYTNKFIVAESFCKSKSPFCTQQSGFCEQQKNSSSDSMCQYCRKTIKYKRNLAQHYKICQAKVIFEEKQKLEKTLMAKQKREEQLEKTLLDKQKKEELMKKEMEQQKEKLEELEEVQTDYYDLLRQIAKNKTSPHTINLHYVVNNFTEALNYEDLMDPKLTDEEVDEVKRLEPIAGTINIIEKRCITGMDVKKRPLHCLDTSRNKYLVRTDNEWVVDHYAKRIFKGAAKHIHDMYATNPLTSNLSLEQIMRNQQKLLKLESKSAKNKMIKDLNDKVYIKNIRMENITDK